MTVSTPFLLIFAWKFRTEAQLRLWERAEAERQHCFGFSLVLKNRIPRQNVEIPLIGTQIEKTNVHKIAGTALRDVELNGFEDFSVRELSGGMCRRVALARAIAFARSGLGRDAAILDEPLKGLDNAMKKRIVPRFIDAFATRVIITHDENEAELFECGTIIRLNRI